MKFKLTWEEIELGPGSYNEAFLAELRKKIVSAEKDGIEVIIELVQEDKHPQAFAHARRRLKNCKAVFVNN